MRLSLKYLLAASVLVIGLAACQKEEDPYMTLSDKTLSVPEEGGTYEVSILANVYYRVNNDIEDWVTCETGATVGDSTVLILTVQANESSDDRSGRIRFIGDYVTPLYIAVSQDGVSPKGVSVNEISVNYYDTETSFLVIGEEDWTASCDNTDFTLSTTSGTGEATIKVTFAENSASTARTATVTVTIAGENYYVTITQAKHPSAEYPVDLSETATSNCYIITAPEYYSFKATVRGNGYLPSSFEGTGSDITADISPVSASVLWCTYNTAVAPASVDALITDVSVSNGYIVFRTADLRSMTYGNAVIAAYDGSGEILWTWHIWISEETPTASYVGSAYWLDRNIGALNATKGDVGSVGFNYQWGRKDPMRGTSSLDLATFIATTPEMESDYIDVDPTVGTVEASIKNPRPFINTNAGTAPKDWVYNCDHTDRWMASQKTMFDPCPVGYKVPSADQMTALGAAAGFSTGSVRYSSNADANAAYQASSYAFDTGLFCLTLCGYQNYNGDGLVYVGTRVRTATSDRQTDHASNVYNFYITDSNFNIINVGTGGHGVSVRCVQE